MNEVFVDTSAWVALVDTNELNHKAAAGVYESLLKNSRLVTTNLVLAETHTTLMRRVNSRVAFAFIENTTSSGRIQIVYSNRGIEEEALRVLRKYADHPISYVDAASFAVMSGRSIRDAFCYDKHFVVAGFNAVGMTGSR
ncbi:MAG: type II toxin-antitoxin system VapC family toxin [Firmicutes bacterium]|nr:type II toxin-antitoxin system VapC family toxin [Bacillota bacterium]